MSPSKKTQPLSSPGFKADMRAADVKIADSGPLGESVKYPGRYDSSVLHRISRSLRSEHSFRSGFDRWVSYEFTFLSESGCPICCALEITIPAETEYIVESKSLKLYLGGFSQERFGSEEQVAQKVATDLRQLLCSQEIKVNPLDFHNKSLFISSGDLSTATLLDDPGIHCTEFNNPNPQILKSILEASEETLYSNLFRSLCPVTAQPDYATVVISYKGQTLERESLLKYLVSYRNHSGFHETCCEQIFNDISSMCHPQYLSVACFFNRRGGIDINPVRSSQILSGNEFVWRCIRQ